MTILLLILLVVYVAVVSAAISMRLAGLILARNGLPSADEDTDEGRDEATIASSRPWNPLPIIISTRGRQVIRRSQRRNQR